MADFELLIATFADETRAAAALAALREAEQRKVLQIVGAAVLVKDRQGELTVTETGDVQAPQGALAGAVLGGLIGLLGGPAGMLAGALAGAATGGAAAQALDLGITQTQITELQKQLHLGSSALLAIISHEWVERVVLELEAFQAVVMRKAVSRKQ